uniref:Uncharacterized protein n=1 Tax=Caenorhabditis japonica TaxID=281687 RepID=A0A8R1ILM1_CAEJA
MLSRDLLLLTAILLAFLAVAQAEFKAEFWEKAIRDEYSRMAALRQSSPLPPPKPSRKLLIREASMGVEPNENFVQDDTDEYAMKSAIDFMQRMEADRSVSGMMNLFHTSFSTFRNCKGIAIPL